MTSWLNEPTANRFGRFAATNVVRGTVLAKSICGADGLPKVYMQAQG
jgi:hypothetical protein